MRPSDFSPLFRSTVGFDRLFDALDRPGAGADWPPYNIERLGENEYRIRMALAGFAPSDVELTQQGNTLIVAGRKQQSQNEMLHQSLVLRDFKQTFNLAAHVKVTHASLDNGLLSIALTREVPEELRPRRIEIGTSGRTGGAQIEQPKLAQAA